MSFSKHITFPVSIDGPLEDELPEAFNEDQEKQNVLTFTERLFSSLPNDVSLKNVKLENLYGVNGHPDVSAVLEAPDEETAIEQFSIAYAGSADRSIVSDVRETLGMNV